MELGLILQMLLRYKHSNTLHQTPDSLREFFFEDKKIRQNQEFIVL